MSQTATAPVEVHGFIYEGTATDGSNDTSAGVLLLVALLAGRSRDLLAGRPYRVVMRVLAALLGVFAILLFREGLKHLALI